LKGIIFSAPMVRAILDGSKTQTRRTIKTTFPISNPVIDGGWLNYADANDGMKYTIKLPFDVGMRLWVKETFCLSADLTPFYKADYGRTPKSELIAEFATWKPSIFMPRCFSRILLEVVEVRCQLLNDISEADAIAEGLTRCSTGAWEIDLPKLGFKRRIDPRDTYAALWDYLNFEKGFGWEQNPYVWAITFRKVKP
jgi:hypothetical protein